MNIRRSTACARGCRVRVPFGGRTVDGYVMRLKEGSDCPADRLKPVLSVVDEALTPECLSLVHSISARYHCPQALTLRLFLPAEMRRGAVRARTRNVVYPVAGASVPARAKAQAAAYAYLLERGGTPLAELSEKFGPHGGERAHRPRRRKGRKGARRALPLCGGRRAAGRRSARRRARAHARAAGGGRRRGGLRQDGTAAARRHGQRQDGGVSDPHRPRARGGAHGRLSRPRDLPHPPDAPPAARAVRHEGRHPAQRAFGGGEVRRMVAAAHGRGAHRRRRAQRRVRPAGKHRHHRPGRGA